MEIFRLADLLRLWLNAPESDCTSRYLPLWQECEVLMLCTIKLTLVLITCHWGSFICLLNSDQHTACSCLVFWEKEFLSPNELVTWTLSLSGRKEASRAGRWCSHRERPRGNDWNTGKTCFSTDVFKSNGSVHWWKAFWEPVSETQGARSQSVFLCVQRSLFLLVSARRCFNSTKGAGH